MKRKNVKRSDEFYFSRHNVLTSKSDGFKFARTVNLSSSCREEKKNRGIFREICVNCYKISL